MELCFTFMKTVIACVVYGCEALRLTYIARQGTHAGHEQTHRLGATPGLPLLLDEQKNSSECLH